MSSMLSFSKMHGLGNDFVVIDCLSQHCPELTLSQRRFIADRQRGIGCDQLLLVEAATQVGVDFKYRIFNTDGGEVSQCGNGARCFARFVYDKGLSDKSEIVVETNSGIITLTVKEEGGIVTVNMGPPQFEPKQIPFITEQQAELYDLNLSDGQTVSVGVLSMGNPHAVMLVDDIETADVARLGPMIEGHDQFPERVNAGFMQVVNESEVKVRVYERGVGETQACGTGACAAAVHGMQSGLLNTAVKVSLIGGELDIVWQGQQAPVWMTGPTTHVFDGEIAWATISNN
jgi:diaminopimelate epimerase